MDNRMFQAGGCDSLKVNTIAQEAQCNVQMLPPTVKQFGYKSLKSQNCLNYYDDLFSASTEIKEEFPEDVSPQSSTAASCINKSSIDSNIGFENEDLSEVPKTQEIKQEVSEEALSFIKTEEIHDEKEMFIAKTEMSEEYRILSNAGDTSVLYKAQTTQEIQPTMCGGILKNGFNLLTHNNEYIKTEPPILVGNEGTELHKCHYCDEYFNHDNMLAHVYDVHSHKKHKSELCDESIKKINTGRNVDKINYKCHICKRTYTSKSTLVSHLKKIHYSNDRISEFWCGKKIPTPIHLHIHKKEQHDANIKSTNNAALITEFQCDICKKMFKRKRSLRQHILNIHYDCNKSFKCWCGKQFRSSAYLYQHKSRQHGANAKSSNNAALKLEFQCNICNKMFKSNSSLGRHIRTIHYDYGKTFQCSCGKEFRTPIHLHIHKKQHHGSNVNSTNNAVLKKEFQCDVCKKIFKTKDSLRIHITSIHYDYGKTFECWCGKHFRTPIHLHIHKYRKHSAKVKSTNNAALKKEFQCDICKKIFKGKDKLKIHIASIHYDYGKTFECWCGKQFRTPIHLHIHKNRQHFANSNSKNNAALKTEFQCDICKKMLKRKENLKQHLLNIHSVCNKAFKCWCGKQFRTSLYLYKHKNRQHGTNAKSSNTAALKQEFQCNICNEVFKSNNILKIHITSIHYDYAKTFKCL